MNPTRIPLVFIDDDVDILKIQNIQSLEKIVSWFFRRKRIKTHPMVCIRKNGCWDWLRRLDIYGYGEVGIGRKVKKAHRVFYLEAIGSIPDGLVIDHLCRNRACVNPKHLDVVTNKENILRGKAATAINGLKKKCIRGHEFTPENTRNKRGWRECRACNRIWNKAYREKAKVS